MKKNIKKSIIESVKMSSKLSDKYRNEVSWNGYPSDIMKSGLQKYIRRGILDKALYCAGELDLFKEAKDRGETVRTNFLHRLMIIYMEDVENMSIFNKIDNIINCIFNERDKSSRNKENEEEWIYDLVYLLTKSKKARVCSHVRAVFNTKYRKILSSYPTIKKLWNEIDKNIEKFGNSLESNCNLFKKYIKEKNILCVYYAFQIELSEEKLKVKYFRSNTPVWFVFDQLLKVSENKDRINKFVLWYKNHIGKMKEGFLCWLFPLLKEIGVISEGQDVIIEENDEKNEKMWNRNRSGESIEIDEYIVDKHTKCGRGKDLVEFALKGAYVENEASFINLLWKKFYEDGKRFEEGQEIIGEDVNEKDKEDENKVPLETDMYHFLVLTQITTSGMKQDVYFAKDKNNKLVVVKGPYSNKKSIDILVRNTEWKKENNIPYIPFQVVELIPNRWPDGIPLGIRNTVDRSKPVLFVVFDSVIQENDIYKKTHSSKLWPETQVVDWDKVPLHVDYKKLSFKKFVDYVRTIIFRYVRGISDYADRNFLVVGDRVISVDEDIEERDVNIYKELRKNKAEYIYNWLKINYDKLDIQNWKGESKYEKNKLDIVKDKKKLLELFKDNSD